MLKISLLFFHFFELKSRKPPHIQAFWRILANKRNQTDGDSEAKMAVKFELSSKNDHPKIGDKTARFFVDFHPKKITNFALNPFSSSKRPVY